MVLDKLTGTDRKYDPNLTNQIAAYRLAKRFDMHGAISVIKECLPLAISTQTPCQYQDRSDEAPRLLAVACQEHPVDHILARAALSMFGNQMPMHHDIYHSALSRRKSDLANPKPHNLQIGYAETLTTAGYMAYSMALEECELEKSGKCWRWESVPDAFCATLERMGR